MVLPYFWELITVFPYPLRNVCVNVHVLSAVCVCVCVWVCYTTRIHPIYAKAKLEFVVGEDSVSVKHDLIDAAETFHVDYLVLGSRGAAHSMRESLEKHVVDALGSVPDYCVHNANCSVVIVKPQS